MTRREIVIKAIRKATYAIEGRFVLPSSEVLADAILAALEGQGDADMCQKITDNGHDWRFGWWRDTLESRCFNCGLTRAEYEKMKEGKNAEDNR